MSCTEQITQRIRAGGFRLTPQRLAILQVLQHAGTHLTPVEVYTLARDAVPGLTEATVYRTLEFLAGNNLAQAVQSGNGKYAYEVSIHPHHHVVCQRCGREFELELRSLNGFFEQISTMTSFRINPAPITFYGVCPRCQE